MVDHDAAQIDIKVGLRQALAIESLSTCDVASSISLLSLQRKHCAVAHP